MYIHTYLVEDHIQTADQKDPPLLSAGLQPEKGVTKKKIIHTHAHVHLHIKFVCVCMCVCLPVRQNIEWEEGAGSLPDLPT